MTVTAIVAIDEVFDWLNTPQSQQGDITDKVQGVIDAATAFVEFETGPIVPRTYTNEVHSGGGPTIVLLNPPILSIASVVEYVGQTGYTLTQCELGTVTGQYSFSLDDAEAGIICRRFNGGIAGAFLGGFRNISVTYTAGRTSVPGDVRMAALEDIRGLFTQTQYGGQLAGITNEQDQWSETAMNPILAFPRLAALLQGPTRTPSIA
jgi:hypothetical protein